MTVLGAQVEWFWHEKTEAHGEKYDTVPFCPPQITGGLVWIWTRASAATGWRLTAWAELWHRLQVLRNNTILVKFLDFKLSPCSECCYYFFWMTPRRLNFICRRFGKLCSIFKGGVGRKNSSYLHRLWRWNRQSVPKRRHIAHLRQEYHNSKFVIFFFQEKLLNTLKCCNFLWVRRRHNCSPAASFANCIMTLYLLQVDLQTFLSIPITQKYQILSCDTLVANEAV